jgi:hypothetical protein
VGRVYYSASAEIIRYIIVFLPGYLHERGITFRLTSRKAFF